MANKHPKKLKDLGPFLQEVRSMDAAKLGAELAYYRGHLLKLRNQSATEKVEDNSDFLRTRRIIARLLTERRAKQLAKAK